MRRPARRRCAETITAAYRKLEEEYGANVAVAVRSSATAEDLPTASFAGQHESFLNIRGARAVIEACRRCFASIFTDRAISYRIDNGFDHFKVALSVGVMKMVRSDRAASGVVFTLDTESGFRDVVFITGAYGLGENVVQGAVDPDEFYVHKPTFREGYRAVLSRRLGRKQKRMIYGRGKSATTRNVATSKADRERFCIGDDDVLKLAGHAIAIEEHYSRAAGAPTPMDIEWAKDGPGGEIYIVQARPETVASRRAPQAFETYALKASGRVLATGRAVGEKIAAGRTRIIKSARDLATFRPGEVLVAPATSPDWEPVMKVASAIVTERGGRTCHAAIVARELGVPAVVGADRATKTLKSGSQVTVSCADGEVGKVYEGRLAFEVNRVAAPEIAHMRTAIMLNLGNPELAFHTAMLPNQGVGLARMEFIISEHIGVHPMALVDVKRGEIAEGPRRHRQSDATLCEARGFLRRAVGGRDRHHRGGILSEAGDRAAFRLQDQRICKSDRRRGFRAEGGQSDARISRRGALRPSGLCGRICARMRGARARAQRHGAQERPRHGAVLPPGRRGAGVSLPRWQRTA